MAGYLFTTLHRTRFFTFLIAHQIVCLAAFAARLIMVCTEPNAFTRFMKWKTALGPTLMKFSWIDPTVMEQSFVLEYLPMVVMTVVETMLCVWSVFVLHRVNVYTAALKVIVPFFIVSAIYWPGVLAMGFFYLLVDIFWGAILTSSSYGFLIYLVLLASRESRTPESNPPTHERIEYVDSAMQAFETDAPGKSRLVATDRLHRTRRQLEGSSR
ncbi:Hypothetical protein D9617_1g084750 [Elsinoe fawcettii]|nr:Hypothetical protein D9617_1g084750 [Elsinoe fawcettii]